MVGTGTPAIFVTFLLAILGYVGLTALVVLTLRGRRPVVLWRVVVGVIVAHVLMVWAFRYGWDPALSVRNGYAGFAVFHAALALLLASTAAPEPAARRMLHAAFAMVTAGALGAAFIYDDVALYRLPVIACALVGGAALVRHYGWRARSSGPRSSSPPPSGPRSL